MASHSRSPSRGRTRSRTPAIERDPSPKARSNSRSQSHTPVRSRSLSRTPRRSVSPRARSLSRTQSASPRQNSPIRNGYDRRESRRSYTRSRSRSPRRGRSRSFSQDGRDTGGYRNRGYSRSPMRSISRDSVAGRKSTKIVVEKLTKNVNEAHLKEIFGHYGTIESIDLPMNRQFMTNRGTAYIVYRSSISSSANPAELAISHMHEAQLDGVVINDPAAPTVRRLRTHTTRLVGRLHPLGMVLIHHHHHHRRRHDIDPHDRLLAAEDMVHVPLIPATTSTALPTVVHHHHIRHRIRHAVDHPRTPAHDLHRAAAEMEVEIEVDLEPATDHTLTLDPEARHHRGDGVHHRQEEREVAGAGVRATVAIALIRVAGVGAGASVEAVAEVGVGVGEGGDMAGGDNMYLKTARGDSEHSMRIWLGYAQDHLAVEHRDEACLYGHFDRRKRGP